MIVIGIDPGLTGGIATIIGDHAEVWPMPVRSWWSGNKKRHGVCAERLCQIIRDITNKDNPCGVVRAFVERAQASPQMGVSSAFNYGHGFGIVLGVLAGLNVSVNLVTAKQWKKHMGLVVSGSRELGRNEARDKNPALRLACALYPRTADKMARAKDDGKTEALLLAHYGCEVLYEKAAEQIGSLFAKRAAPAGEGLVQL